MLHSGTQNNWQGTALLATVLLCLMGAASAENDAVASDGAATTPQASASDAAAQANNPLANFTALNIHNYVIGELTEPEGEAANQFWLRYAKPFTAGNSSWLMRASLPVSSFPVPPTFENKTGLGDLNVFAAYLFDMGDRKLACGVGPQITIPTATNDGLGSEKWSAGLVHTIFDYSSPKLQWGYLMSWQGSFAGADDRADVSLGGFQPFVFYQLGDGKYLRSSAVMSYNFEADTYSVPLGLGIGKVIPTKKAIYNVFIEPQFSVADKGAGWPEWQVFFALNTQFNK